MTRVGHVSLWHSWKDKPGQRHKLSLWNKGDVTTFGDQHFSVSSVEQAIEIIGGNRLYAYCNDILSGKEFPFGTQLIRNDKTTPYISRTGHIVALRLRHKRASGFLIPGIGWGAKRSPDTNLLNNILYTFTQFGFEALTPASLSEKVLRSTLPERCFISRPSVDLRRVLLETEHGGRIDVKETMEYYERIYEYDINKAYLHFAGFVPSPFLVPVCLYQPDNGRWADFPTSFLHVKLIAHQENASYPSPIQIYENNKARKPQEGELIDRWLWKEELDDCLNAGYTLLDVSYAYCFREMSTFMQQWSDILLTKYEQCENKEQKDIIKSMMVGLPGRFLKRPEQYTLAHINDLSSAEIERRKKDDSILPVPANYLQDDLVTTPWVVLVDEDKESAQLTPIGSYITMKCRQEIYKVQLREVEQGNEIISTYIDCVRLASPSVTVQLSDRPGDYKEKEYQEVVAEENRIYGYHKRVEVLKAPAYSGVRREQLRKLYALRVQKGRRPP